MSHCRTSSIYLASRQSINYKKRKRPDSERGLLNWCQFKIQAAFRKHSKHNTPKKICSRFSFPPRTKSKMIVCMLTNATGGVYLRLFYTVPGPLARLTLYQLRRTSFCAASAYPYVADSRPNSNSTRATIVQVHHHFSEVSSIWEIKHTSPKN